MTDINELTAKLEATEQHAERGWNEAHEQEARAEAAEKRIAELEARTLTVTLPKRRTHEDYVDARFSNADLAAIYNATVTSYTRLIEAACDETGIKLQIEGE